MSGPTDLPRRAVARSARLAALPLGFAGRTAVGFGKRLGGANADEVQAEIQMRTAEQVFRVLGQLKGGAMKFGQALSIFEAAFPEELAKPYRQTLTKLQDAAPPMNVSLVHDRLEESFGPSWRSKFRSFDDTPAAAASIGQVHRAVWTDGRRVAVKVQYPNAGPAIMSDLDQLGRMSKLLQPMAPGMDVKPLLAEVRSRLLEELDYTHEAASQREFFAVYDGHPQIAVPDVVDFTATVLITEWLEGTPMSRYITSGTQTERDEVGLQYLEFLFSGPEQAHMLHADPHPGNYRRLPDGRLGVLDFGAVAHLPDGLPAVMGRLMKMSLEGDADGVLRGLVSEGFIKGDVGLDARPVLEYLEPFVEPARHERFQFNRDWMRSQANRVGDPRNGSWDIGLKINLPPDYMLVHRVWLGGIGVLCQLGAEVPVKMLLERWLRGFNEETATV